MTDEQLEAIKRRHREVTQGPHFQGSSVEAKVIAQGRKGLSTFVYAQGRRLLFMDPVDEPFGEPMEQQFRDRSFFAHAWQDIRDLVEEVERLRTGG